MKREVFSILTAAVIISATFISCKMDSENDKEYQMIMTTSSSNEVYFDIYGSGTATIDLGDGLGKQVVNITDYPNSTGRFYHEYSYEASRTITISGKNITHFECAGQGQLTSLDVSNNPALIHLVCANNKLTSLDVSNNPALIYLDCSGNRLKSLDVSKNTALTYLGCSLNQLTSLDLSSCTELTTVWCHSNNDLTSLNLSGCTKLTELYCYGNGLISLNLSDNVALEIVFCRRNPLTGLNLSKNTKLRCLDCRWSELDADLLNVLFETLHDNEGNNDEKKIISIYGNPGIYDCDQSIAEDKGWTFYNTSQI